MPEKKEPCPVCHDTGFIGTGYTEKEECGKRAIYPYAKFCYCIINKQISTRFPELAGLPDVTEKDTQLARAAYGYKDTKFFGNIDRFLFIVKSMFAGEFNKVDYMLLQSSRLVEEYHSPNKAKDTWLKLTHLNQYRLLAILLISNLKYDSLPSCVADVVKNRRLLRVPTWVYAMTEATLQSGKEYSPELGSYIEDFQVVNVDDEAMKFSFSASATESTQRKQAIAVNQKYSNT